MAEYYVEEISGFLGCVQFSTYSAVNLKKVFDEIYMGLKNNDYKQYFVHLTDCSGNAKKIFELDTNKFKNDFYELKELYVDCLFAFCTIYEMDAEERKKEIECFFTVKLVNDLIAKEENLNYGEGWTDFAENKIRYWIDVVEHSFEIELENGSVLILEHFIENVKRIYLGEIVQGLKVWQEKHQKNNK